MASDCTAVEAFGIVLIVVALVAVVVSAASYWGSGRMYKGIGASDLVMDRERVAPDSAAVAQEEIRQMLEAKSARRVARGQPALDVDAELAALGEGPGAGNDPGLREEVRQLVEARNARRLRQGKEALDVEAEVNRRLRELGGDTARGAG
jgi:hypothetical protein